jgi:glycosyltransferase involved in cell wall biosynthesis
MKILWFNWRDIKNPEAGGAEVLTHEIASRLVNGRNNQVTLFTSQYPNAAASENLNGINIIRQGGRFSVYRRAKQYYQRNKNDFDLIIDEINVRPFLTPKFVKDERPILALIHQISPEQFLLELPFPLNYLGRYYLEKKWLSYYKEILTVTVSNSTRIDLKRLGFKRVQVIPEGLSVMPLGKPPQKESSPTVVFIGRLKRHKLPDHAIRAFSLIKKDIPDSRLWVIGDGYMRQELESKFDTKGITFFGHVSCESKYNLLSRAHLVLLPAIREGWALVVTEANAVGTPVVAYNVSGLRDSIKHNETGVLVEENSPSNLASWAVNLLRNRTLLEKYSYNSLLYSKQFNWDISTKVFENSIRDAIRSKELQSD